MTKRTEKREVREKLRSKRKNIEIILGKNPDTTREMGFVSHNYSTYLRLRFDGSGFKTETVYGRFTGTL